MVRKSPRLEQNVDMAEEMEQRRLEGLLPLASAAETGNRIGGRAVGGGVISKEVEQAASHGGLLVVTENGERSGGAGGEVVQGAAQRRDQLAAKMFSNGGFRSSRKIVPLLPLGGAGLKTTVPKRKEFGAEGAKGDVAHAAAMKQFSVKEFGSTHVQGGSIDRRMQRVGLFGYWLKKNKYGKYVEWHVKTRKEKGSQGRILVACDEK